MARWKFGFRFSSEFIGIFIKSILICVSAVAVSYIYGTMCVKYIIGILILLVALCFCALELNQRIHIIANIKRKFKV